MFESKFRVLAMGARMPHGGVVLDRSRLLLACSTVGGRRWGLVGQGGWTTHLAGIWRAADVNAGAGRGSHEGDDHDGFLDARGARPRTLVIHSRRRACIGTAKGRSCASLACDSAAQSRWWQGARQGSWQSGWPSSWQGPCARRDAPFSHQGAGIVIRIPSATAQRNYVNLARRSTV